MAGNTKLSDITEEATNLTDPTRFYVEQGLVEKFTLWSTIKAGIQAIITFLSLPDTPNSFVGQTLKFLRVNAGENAMEFADISTTDEKLKISSADTTEGFGEDKIVAGTNIIINKLNTGANEQLEIESTGGGGALDEMLEFHTFAGFGSTDDKIPRFSTKLSDTGTSMTHNHDSGYNGNTEGLEITIGEKGNYSMQLCWDAPVSGNVRTNGVSLNSSQLTTTFIGIAIGDRKSFGGHGFNGRANDSVTLNLDINDIIRPHFEVSDSPFNTALCIFTIVKVSA